MKKIISLLLACAVIISMFTISAFAAEGTNVWICEDDGEVGVWLNNVDDNGDNIVEGAAFNASDDWSAIVFKTIWGSPKAETTLGWSIRVNLYAYDTDYETSIKGTPIATKDFEGESNIGMTYEENGEKKTRPEGVAIDFGKTFGAGKYVFTVQIIEQVDMENRNHFWTVLPKCEFLATDLLKAEFGRQKFGFGVKFVGDGKFLNMNEDAEAIKEAEELAKKEKAEKEREATYGNTALFDEESKLQTGWWFKDSLADSYLDVTFTADKWFSGIKAFYYGSVAETCLRIDLMTLSGKTIASTEKSFSGNSWATIDFEKQIQPGDYIVEFYLEDDMEEETHWVLGSADAGDKEVTVEAFGANTNENTLEYPAIYLLNCAEGTPIDIEDPTAEPTEEPTAEPTEEPTAAPTAEPTEEPTAEPTPEPAKKKGCKSIIGGSAAIVLAACALVIRKKED